MVVEVPVHDKVDILCLDLWWECWMAMLRV
jgi:hypothetical protein